MTVDTFLASAEGQPGRFELVDGEVFAMAPERAGHALMKYAAQTALKRAIVAAGADCHMMPDGMTICIATEGTLDLSPPGLTLMVAELFADLPPPAETAA